MDLSEIEKAVLDNHMIDRVAVIVYKPNEPTQKVLCYFTLKSTSINQKVCSKAKKEKEFTGMKLKENLKTVLPDYMMPNSIIKLKGMPLLVNGKCLRLEHIVQIKWLYLILITSRFSIFICVLPF